MCTLLCLDNVHFARDKHVNQKSLDKLGLAYQVSISSELFIWHILVVKIFKSKSICETERDQGSRLAKLSLKPTSKIFGRKVKSCSLWSPIIVIAQQLQRTVFFQKNQLQSKSFSNQNQNVARLCLLHYSAATIQHFSNLIIAPAVKKLLFAKLLHHGNHGKTLFLGHKGSLWLLLKLRDCTILTGCKKN